MGHICPHEKRRRESRPAGPVSPSLGPLSGSLGPLSGSLGPLSGSLAPLSGSLGPLSASLGRSQPPPSSLRSPPSLSMRAVLTFYRQRNWEILKFQENARARHRCRATARRALPFAGSAEYASGLAYSSGPGTPWITVFIRSLRVLGFQVFPGGILE